MLLKFGMNDIQFTFFRTPPPRFPMRGPPQGAKAPGATGAGRT